ncbi:MAG: thioesterase family protein [Pyrinomonadaceae bacterium]
MASLIEKQFEAGWRDVDANGHVANSSYMEFAVDMRVAFFASCGFPPENFLKYGFGPVVKTDTIEYYRELMMLERFTVTIENGGFSDDGSRFRVVNNFYKLDGTHAARVISIGGWLGLRERKLVAPPKELKSAWLKLHKTEDFEELGSSIRR